MWQELGLFCLPLPLLLFFLAYKQLLRRYETRTLISRLRSAVGTSALAGRDQLSLHFPEPVWIDVEAAAR